MYNLNLRQLRLSLSILLLLLCTQAYNQIFTDDFSTQKYTVTLGGEGLTTVEDYFVRTDGSNIDKGYNGFTGMFFAAQDIDGGSWEGATDPSQLTWENIDISNYSDLNISIKIASLATEKIDAADYLTIEYNIDNGGWNYILAFENDGTSSNTYFLEDTDFDGTGDETQLTEDAQIVQKNISETGSLLQIRITVDVDSGDEDIAFDDLIITGTENIGTPTITITETTLDNFAYEEENGPSTSQSFSIEGQNLIDGVSINPTTNYEISINNTDFKLTPITLSPVGTSLNQTTIYVRLKSGLALGDYASETVICSSDGASSRNITCNGSVTLAEPSNHVSNFIANAGSASSITLAWNDDNGLVDSHRLLVQISSENTFTLPIDNIESVQDLDLSDGNGQDIIVRGTEAYTWENLSENTQYYFQITPFTNEAINYNYKTNESIPSTNTSTCAVNNPPIAIKPNIITNNAFTALWNKNDHANYYLLDVYTESNENVTYLINEPFDNGISPFPTDWERSDKTYTYSNGNPGKAIKLGAASTAASISSLNMDCSGNSGEFSVKLDALQYNNSENKITIAHASDGINYNDEQVLTLSDRWGSYSVIFPGGTANSRVKISTYSTSQERAYIDNVIVHQGDFTKNYLSGYEGKQINDTIESIENLSPENSYYYKLKSYDDCGSGSNSEYSNTIKVTTPEFLSPENDIETFSVTNISGTATINASEHTISLDVLYGTDITALTTELSISEFAMVSPTNNSVLDYSNRVQFDVIAQDGTVQPWWVTISVKANTDASLNEISINDILLSNFEATTYHYEYLLPYGSNINDALVAASKNDENASLQIQQATKLTGNETERTATITAYAEDGETSQEYTIIFTIAEASSDAMLSEIKVGNVLLSSFSNTTFNYTILLHPSSTIIPDISSVLNDENANLEITEAQNLTGSLTERTSTLTVTSQDGLNRNTYNITFRLESTNAQLSSLTIDNLEFSNFNPANYTYTEYLDYGTTTIPVINAIAADSNATIQIIQASNLEGNTVERTTNITVKAEDDETFQEYTITFEVSLNHDCKLQSDEFNVNEDEKTISDIPYDYTLALFEENIQLPEGASIVLYESDTITPATTLSSLQLIIVKAENNIDSCIYKIILNETPKALNLIISQYYEGFSNNKWIEIYNADTTAVNLKDYQLCRWTNAYIPESKPSSTFQFPDSIIAPKATILIKKSTSVLPDYANTTFSHSVNGFNGNDPIAITFLGNDWDNRIDCIYSTDSVLWGSDKCFVRKESINKGNTAPSDFEPWGEWVSYPIHQIDSAENVSNIYLGFHEYKADSLGPIALANFKHEDTLSIMPTISFQFNEALYSRENSEVLNNANLKKIFAFYESTDSTNIITYDIQLINNSLQVNPLTALDYETYYTLSLNDKVLEDQYGNANQEFEISFTSPKAIIPTLAWKNTQNDYYILDEEITIKWQLEHIDSIKLEYYLTSQNQWFPLTEKISGTLNELNFKLDDTLDYQSECKFRLSDVSNDSVFIESEYFEIIPVANSIEEIKQSTHKVMYRGESTITYSQNYRGQKYMQDNDNALLIDDVEGIITEEYTIGDVLSNTLFNVQKINQNIIANPISDPGKPIATNANIIPDTVSIKQLKADPYKYQSKLVYLPYIKFDTDDEIFAKGEQYILHDNNDSLVFYSIFYEADYINTTIPKHGGSIKGIITVRDSNVYITSRLSFDMFFESLSTNCNLSELNVNSEIIDSFAIDKQNYYHFLNNADSLIPNISAQTQDPFAHLSIIQANSIPGKGTIKVVAQDTNYSKEYTVYFTKEQYNNIATLKSVLINDTIYQAFNDSTFEYSIMLPFGTNEFPNFDISLTDSNAVTNIKMPTNLPGTVSIIVTAENGINTRVYNFYIHTKYMSNIASLSAILINEEPLARFHPDSLHYTIDLKANQAIPTISAISVHEKAKIEITPPNTLPGNAIISVIAEDSLTTRDYIINFNTLPLNQNALLSALWMDNQALEGFDSTIFNYNITLNKDYEGIPNITYQASDSIFSTAELSVATSMPGTTHIKIQAEDTSISNTYAINFTYELSSNALLSEIKIDDEFLINFQDSLLEYDIVWPTPTHIMPIVSGTAQHDGALISITQLNNIPDTAIIEVLAADGITKNYYNLNFSYRQPEYYTVSFQINDEENDPINGAQVIFDADTIYTDLNGRSAFDSIAPILDAPVEVYYENHKVYENYISVVNQDVSLNINLISIGINQTLDTWEVYPNPTSGTLYYKSNQNKIGTSVIIYTMEGRIIHKETVKDQLGKINISYWPHGIYFITFTNGLNHNRQRFVVD